MYSPDFQNENCSIYGFEITPCQPLKALGGEVGGLEFWEVWGFRGIEQHNVLGEVGGLRFGGVGGFGGWGFAFWGCLEL